MNDQCSLEKSKVDALSLPSPLQFRAHIVYKFDDLFNKLIVTLTGKLQHKFPYLLIVHKFNTICNQNYGMHTAYLYNTHNNFEIQIERIVEHSCPEESVDASLTWPDYCDVKVRNTQIYFLKKWQPRTCYILTFGKSRELSFLTAVLGRN